MLFLIKKCLAPPRGQMGQQHTGNTIGIYPFKGQLKVVLSFFFFLKQGVMVYIYNSSTW